jgi:ABC-type Na+ efflux pump permease subunit
MLVGMLLPYMLILFSAMSGFYAAIDMTAGEKERGTMQTLLCAPVESLEIISGKFFAVWTIATIRGAFGRIFHTGVQRRWTRIGVVLRSQFPHSAALTDERVLTAAHQRSPETELSDPPDPMHEVGMRHR